jgi:hypothetical protein
VAEQDFAYERSPFTMNPVMRSSPFDPRGLAFSGTTGPVGTPVVGVGVCGTCAVSAVAPQSSAISAARISGPPG